MEKLRISCVPVGNAIKVTVILYVRVWVNCYAVYALEPIKHRTTNTKPAKCLSFALCFNHLAKKSISKPVVMPPCLYLNSFRYCQKAAVVYARLINSIHEHPVLNSLSHPAEVMK